MLKQVRGVLKGAVAWIFVILLILAFALFGVPSLNEFAGNSAVTVGGQSFSSQYVQNEFNRAVQIQAAESGGSFTRDDAIAAGLPNQVIGSISTVAALDQFSKDLNLATPRSLVADYLQGNENFQNPATGQFDQTVLTSILQRINISAEEFESRIAGELQRGQLVESLALQSNAPTTFSDFMMMRETERRRIAYLVVTDEMAGKSAEPTPDDLERYYLANAQAFTAPEYRNFDMLVLRKEDFRDGVGITEEELRQIYDQNKERIYEKPELRTLYQITYDSETKANAATAALRQGESFEKLATDKGLTLEAVTFADAQQRDILDPGVAEAAFKEDLTEGDIVDPVTGLFGWTVVQIAGITPPEVTTFEEARTEIEDNYLAQDTRRAMLNAIDEIEEERDTGVGLQAAAEVADLTASAIGPVDQFSFAPGGAIINDIPGEALAEVFLLDEGQESEAIQLSDGEGYVFVGLNEITPPQLIAFEDVRDEVESRWRKQERDQRILNAVEEIRKIIAEGSTLAEAADQFDRSPITIVVDRQFQNEVISTDLNDKIFAAAPNGLVSAPAALGEAQIIAEIEQVASSPQAAPPQQAAFFRQYLGYQLDQEVIEAFLESVRGNYDIKVNQAQIDALFSEQ